MKKISKKIMFSFLTLVIMIPMCAVMSSAKAATYESEFPDENFRKSVLSLIGNPKESDEIDTAKLAEIKTLNVSRKSIKSMEGIKYLIGLTDLDCSKNWLTSLDLSKNTALTKLTCNTNLKSYFSGTLTMNVSGCINLKELDCSYSGLTNLDLSKNTALTKLDYSNNNLTNLDLSKNTALQELNCSRNGMTSLDLSKNTALTKLDCSNNNLTNLDLKKNTALQELNCSSNRMTSLDLSKNASLTKLTCTNGSIFYALSTYPTLKSLNVRGCINLQELDCSNNKITKLDLSKNPALTKLDCSTNKITKLDVSKNKSLKNIKTDSKTKISGVSSGTAVYYGSMFTEHAGAFIGVGAFIVIAGIAAFIVIRKRKKSSQDIEQ